MNHTTTNLEKIKDIFSNNSDILENIIDKITQVLKGKREIMYSDIINFIIRKEYFEEGYKQLILWCNYKIRLGETYVKFE